MRTGARRESLQLLVTHVVSACDWMPQPPLFSLVASLVHRASSLSSFLLHSVLVVSFFPLSHFQLYASFTQDSSVVALGLYRK